MVKVSWSEMKDFLDSRQERATFIEQASLYRIFGSDGSIVFEHHMDRSPSDTTDLDDFEANYKTAGNKPFIQNVLPSVSPVETSLRIEGDFFTVPNGTTVKRFFLLDGPARLRGAEFQFNHAVAGDSVKVTVVDKDPYPFKNILYPDPLMGLAVNNTNFPDGVPLTEYIPHLCVYQSASGGQGVVSKILDPDTSDELPDGLYLRIDYTSTGGTDVECLLNFWKYVEA